MSQIASAFAVPSSALPAVQRHLRASDSKGFWECLRPFEVGAGFPYSGYVVVVLTEYLRQAGVELPISRDHAVRPLVERCNPLACASRTEAAAAAALAEVGTSDAVLAGYWRDFTGDQASEAGAAMRAALDW